MPGFTRLTQLFLVVGISGMIGFSACKSSEPSPRSSEYQTEYDQQLAKEREKEQRREEKELRKEIGRKPHRDARKEAKEFEKNGWYTAAGAIPLDKQIENGWMMQYQEDEEGYPLYLVAAGNSVAESQSAAKLQATELAKLELAGLVQTRITALIENNVATNQLSAEEAASVTKTVAASKNIIAQEIGRVLVFFEMYKRHGNNVEATVRVGYNTDMAQEAAKQAVRDQLEDQTDLLQEKIDKLLDF